MLDPQLIYVAIFGRPADPLGLAYWNDATKGGADLSPLVDLTGTTEYLDRFDGLNSDQIVNSLYQNLFNRNADAEGLAFFSDLLDTGAQSIDTIARHMAGAAQSVHAENLDAKIAAANLFTDRIDTSVEVAGYQGDVSAQQAIDFLKTVGVSYAPTPADVDAVISGFVECACAPPV